MDKDIADGYFSVNNSKLILATKEEALFAGCDLRVMQSIVNQILANL